jgi:type II secretory pathway pseudopilin PulG
MNIRHSKAMTILELMLAAGMMGILTTAVFFVFNAQFKAWNENYARSSARGNLSQALELAVQSLRQAQSIDDLNESSVTFTADLGNGSRPYRLYLYNADDPEPNGPYTQDTYSLRFAQGPVNYGDGAALSDIARPTGPVFSMDNHVITIDLTALGGSQEVKMRTSVRPRNL